MTKKGLLTKSERSTLEKLLSDPEFRGKKQLRQLIWMNTTKPKYKVGDCYQVTDRSRRLFGVPAVNINARVVKVYPTYYECEWRYELEAHVVNGDGRELAATMFAAESELGKKVLNNENLVNGSGKHADSITPDIGI